MLVLDIEEVVVAAVVPCIEVADILVADLGHTHDRVTHENAIGTSIDHIHAVQCLQEGVMLVTETILPLLDV